MLRFKGEYIVLLYIIFIERCGKEKERKDTLHIYFKRHTWSYKRQLSFATLIILYNIVYDFYSVDTAHVSINFLYQTFIIFSNFVC